MVSKAIISIVSAGLIMGGTWGGASAVPDRLSAADELVTAVAAVCGFGCSHTSCGGAFEAHEVWSSGEGFNGAEHNCKIVPLGCGYHNCMAEEQEPQDIDRLADLLPDLSPDEVLALAARKASVQINRDRSAIQVFGCNEDVIAHVPMSAEQAAAFPAD